MAKRIEEEATGAPADSRREGNPLPRSRDGRAHPVGALTQPSVVQVGNAFVITLPFDAGTIEFERKRGGVCCVTLHLSTDTEGAVVSPCDCARCRGALN
jgi:hypothetical protein